MLSPTIQKGKEKNVKGKKKGPLAKWCDSSERESSFSLEIRVIRPSAVFGTRRRAALRREGFVWVPDLVSFLKLRKVGVSPYLGFILCLSTMLMFRLVEASNDRLIGSKPWNRNAWILRPTNSPYQFYGLFGLNV